MTELDDQGRRLLASAGSLRSQGRLAEAEQVYRALLAHAPDLPDSWFNLAWLQRHLGQYDEAIASYGQALQRGISGPEEVHLNRGVIFADHLARPDLAADELYTALTLAPDYPPALLNLGNLQEDLGNREAASETYQRLLALDPGNATTLSRLAGLTQVAEAGPMIDRLRIGLGHAAIVGEDRAALGFALGRLLDAVGDYDAAFAAYAAANQACRAEAPPYNRQAEARSIDAIIRAFDQPVTAAPAGDAPIFILGMFRAGSTLIEQVLAGHSRITPGGELPYLPTIARKLFGPELRPEGPPAPADIAAAADAYRMQAEAAFPGHDRLTDKRPDNFLHIGLIQGMFPGARILNTVRNPIDNLLSIYFLHVDSAMRYAFDLGDIAYHIGLYRRLMEHWRSLYGAAILDISYDAFVTDPEPNLRAMLDHLALDFEPACLDFQTRANAVRTASVWQVREPLHARSSGRWQNYARHLEPILDQLPT